MKLNRTLFPPLTKEDFVNEFLITKENVQDFKNLLSLPPELRPGRFRIRINKPRAKSLEPRK